MQELTIGLLSGLELRFRSMYLLSEGSQSDLKKKVSFFGPLLTESLVKRVT